MSVDVIMWSGVVVAFVLEILATHIIYNDLLQWLAFGALTLVFVLALKNRRHLNKYIFQGQVEEFIATMVLVCLFVAAFFSMLAGRFHLALFWWLAGMAFVTGIILRTIITLLIFYQEKKAQEQD